MKVKRVKFTTTLDPKILHKLEVQTAKESLDGVNYLIEKMFPVYEMYYNLHATDENKN